MKPYLTINDSVVGLYVDGNGITAKTADISTSALLDAFLTLGFVVMRRLQDVRATSSGAMAGGAHTIGAGR
jgi:hypothetical protein